MNNKQNQPVNIIIDDDPIRKTPNGFKRFYNSDELIDFIQSHDPIIENITFDNDLGYDSLEGYEIVKMLIADSWHVKNVNLHSANIVAVKNMKQILESAIRHDMLPDLITITTYDLKSYNEMQ